VLGGQPALQVAVAMRVLRVRPQVVPEQPLVAGVPGRGRHHVQVVSALVVLVAEVEQAVRHAVVEPLVAEPGQVGLPPGDRIEITRGHQVDDRLGRQSRHRRAADVLDRAEHPERDKLRPGRRRPGRPRLVVPDDLYHRTASVPALLTRTRPGR
jgi:hypothetical protein